MKKLIATTLATIAVFVLNASPVKLILAAKGVEAIGEEASYTAKDYIQDGLVAMWDGIENAGWGVHDANATTWKDLIGDLDLSKGNASYTWGNNYTQLTRTGAGWNISQFTSAKWVEVVFSMIGEPSDNVDGLVHLTPKNNTTRKDGQAFVRGGTLNVGFGLTKSIETSYNAIHTVSFNSDKTSYPWFFDGVEITMATGTVYNNGSPSYIAIGSFYAGSNSRIYNTRFYSRALTPEEITHNYLIDKERFNIE